jgi:hypothetical protein
VKDVIPDGGYGWVIVGAILACNAVTWGEWNSSLSCYWGFRLGDWPRPRSQPVLLSAFCFVPLCIRFSTEHMLPQLNPAHSHRHQHHLRRLLSLLPRLQLLSSHHTRLRVGRRPLRRVLAPVCAPRELPHKAISLSPANVHG